MPTYEYQCENCGNRFEKFQNIKAKPVKTCPHCGGTVRRLPGTGSAFIFKGSGSQPADYPQNQPNPTRCGRDKPCCGRDIPCDLPPCRD